MTIHTAHGQWKDQTVRDTTGPHKPMKGLEKELTNTSSLWLPSSLIQLLTVRQGSTTFLVNDSYLTNDFKLH